MNEEATSPSDRLRFLAKARREYGPETDPKDWQEIQAMPTNDLIIWVEALAAEKLAGYLEHPGSALGWLPSWRWDEWRDLTLDNWQESKR